ncbi:MAG TPA: LysM domain-containing protein, partial [Polyangiales bacterium]|nr:LysM domain-containing protein [Polyangiales bacterium]
MRNAILRLLPLLFVAVSCRDSGHSTPERKPVTLASTVNAHPSAPAEPAPPPQPTIVTHTIDDGQTLWDIAHVYGVTVKQLMESNGFGPDDVKRLRKGRQLKIEKPDL